MSSICHVINNFGWCKNNNARSRQNTVTSSNISDGLQSLNILDLFNYVIYCAPRDLLLITVARPRFNILYITAYVYSYKIAHGFNE